MFHFNLGGGFWNTSQEQSLLESLKNNYPGFYQKNNYRLLDTRTIFSEEHTTLHSIERKKIVQKINGALEKGVKHPLNFVFNASEFRHNFIKYGFSKTDLFR